MKQETSSLTPELDKKMSKGRDCSAEQKPLLNVGPLSHKDNKVKTVAPTPVKD